MHVITAVCFTQAVFKMQNRVQQDVMCCMFLSSGSPAEMSPSTLSPVSHGLGKSDLLVYLFIFSFLGNYQ